MPLAAIDVVVVPKWVPFFYSFSNYLDVAVDFIIYYLQIFASAMYTNLAHFFRVLNNVFRFRRVFRDIAVLTHSTSYQ